jgi:16S rRNA (cytosine967-C5)-methyltransferase
MPRADSRSSPASPSVQDAPATPAVTGARRCAFAVVRRVFEQGAYADSAFRSEAARHDLEGRDRALAMQLAYGTVQRRATLDHLIERLTDRGAGELDGPIAAALRIGLYQIVYLGGVPDHAAVDESVELAKQGPSGGHRLVNAALRRATREAHGLVRSLEDGSPAEAALRHSHPRWVAELWWEMLGADEALALMERDNEPAESAVRANTLKVSAAELVSLLAREGVVARTDPLVPEAVVLEQPYDVHSSALFADGSLMSQSRGSMLVARVTDPQPGEQMLDLCAAPGAKTTHLAALMGDEGRIVAVDLNPRRVEAIAANCERLGVRAVEARAGDATEPAFGEGFDRVLVDPPCSDLGTLQSRPDARWRKQPGQVRELRAIQRRVLDAAAAAVRPGGRVVYSTCTIGPLENERQIADFLARRQDFSAIDLRDVYPDVAAVGGGPFLQTLPHRHGTDGFFIAALERSA